MVLMPATKERPHQTDLMLCGHHYRLSRQRLAAAGAQVLDLEGAPVTGDGWTLTGTSAAFR